MLIGLPIRGYSLSDPLPPYPEEFITINNDIVLDLDKCCKDPHIKSCVGVNVNPNAILAEAHISLSALSFSNYIEPSGIVYKNKQGDEGIFR